MAMKDFDFKQFMLEKGEKVGLGLGAGIMVLLLIFGLGKAFSAGSPSKTSKEISDRSKAVQGRINDPNNKPPEGEEAKDADALMRQVNFNPVNADDFRTTNPFFLPSSVEDTKRRNPDILLPTEIKAELVLMAMRGMIISTNNAQVAVLEEKGAGGNRPRPPSMMSGGPRGGGGGSTGIMPPGMGGSMGGPPGGSMMMPPGGGVGGPPMGGGSGAGGDGRGSGGGTGVFGGPGAGGMTGLQDYGPKRPLPLKYLDFDKVEGKDVKIAEAIYPMHAVQVTAAFPYKAQWEEFRRALRKRSMNDLFAANQAGEAPFEFKGFEIWRRVLYPDGREKEKWEDYTPRWKGGLQFVFRRAVEFEQEDPKLKNWNLVPKGLATFRPVLARGQGYPKVELKTLQDTVDALEKANKDANAPVVTPRGGGRLGGEGFDPTDPSGTSGETPNPQGGGAPTVGPRPPSAGGPGGGAAGDGGGRPEGGASMTSEPTLPEYVLARFLDVLVEPGYIYEYKFKVGMLNPNLGRKDVAYPSLAKPKELYSKEFTKPVTLAVPADSAYFVVDEKPEGRTAAPPMTRELMPVQIHRWVGEEQIDPENQDSRRRFGEWVILERFLFPRGEYLQRKVDMEVPFWWTEAESWVLVHSIRRDRGRKIPMEFSTRVPHHPSPALLVDFEGGNRVRYPVGSRAVMDDSPVKALLLTPDGKLIVHDSMADTENEERAKRVKDWRDFLKEVKNPKAKDQKPGGLFDPGGGGPRGGSGT
jgi:hypothetical protein